jgi:hypothetical protein
MVTGGLLRVGGYVHQTNGADLELRVIDEIISQELLGFRSGYGSDKVLAPEAEVLEVTPGSVNSPVDFAVFYDQKTLRSHLDTEFKLFISLFDKRLHLLKDLGTLASKNPTDRERVRFF